MGVKKMSFKDIVNKWCETNLILRILIVGLGIGALLGIFVPQATGIGLLGDLFVGTLKAVAPVLVFLLVSSSLSRASEGIGSKFKICIILYIVSMILAGIVSVLMSFAFPVSLTFTTATQMSAPASLGALFSDFIVGIVSNPVTAIMEGNYISILFWAVCFGLIFRVTAGENSIKVLKDCSDTVAKFIRAFIQLAPFGIMGLVFSAVSQNGIEIFTIYGKIMLLIVSCVLIVALVTDPAICGFMLKRNPYPLVFTCIKESGITAFFTRSSAANIPINLRLCERLGLDEDFYSVSIPLGATINMEGATVTITVMTLALCHTLGIGVSIPAAIALCFIASLAACGAAGVPGGSLLLIPMAAAFFGITNDVAMQAIAIGFIISVVQDSFETALNSTGDAIISSTTEYYLREKRGEEVNFLGEFAK